MARIAMYKTSYHPDYNCRFWNFTKSVLLKIEVADYTADREFHPAPEVLCKDIYKV